MYYTCPRRLGTIRSSLARGMRHRHMMILKTLPIFEPARLNAARSYYFRPPLYAPPEVPGGRRGHHGTASAPSRWSGVGLAVKSNFFLEGLLAACSS